MRASLTIFEERTRSHPITALWLNESAFGPPIRKTFPGDGDVNVRSAPDSRAKI